MNRNQHVEIVCQLEKMNEKLSDVERIAIENRDELRRVIPQKTLKPVPRPRQGAQMSRGTNVTKYMRQYTKEKNTGLAENQARYEEFSDEIEDKQYNNDAMNCLEWILGLHLGSDLGILTWDQVCKRDPRKMGLIIRDAMNAPELGVFSQAAGQWAIQMLIANKMNSRLRYNRDHSRAETDELELPELAPTTVPDMRGDQADTGGRARMVRDDTSIQERHLGLEGNQIHQGEALTALVPRLNNGFGNAAELTRGGLPNQGSSTFHGANANPHESRSMGRNTRSQRIGDQRTSVGRGRSVSRGRNARTRGISRAVPIRSRSNSRRGGNR